MIQLSFETCYAQLGLAFGADADDVQKAWKKRTLKCHPDRFAGNPKAYAEATALQMEVNNARDQLLKFFKDYPGAVPPRQPTSSWQASSSSSSQRSQTHRSEGQRTGTHQSRTNTGYGENRQSGSFRTGAGSSFRSSQQERRYWGSKQKPQSDVWQRFYQERERQTRVAEQQRRAAAIHRAQEHRRRQFFVVACWCFAAGGFLFVAFSS